MRPGQALKFEEQLRAIKSASEKATPPLPSYVSQSAVGQQGTVFYISAFRSSLGGFDGATPLPQLLGEEGYQKFLKAVSESVSSTEVTLNRFLPELSNAPEDVAAVAPDFWRPKPTGSQPTTAKPPAKKKE